MGPVWPLVLTLLATPESLAHEKKGVQLLLSGRVDDAQRELETCVRLDPNAASCHRHLGVLFAQRDDANRSIHHYKVYVTLDPYADDAGAVRRIISEITGEKLPEPPPRTLTSELKNAGAPPLDAKIKTLAREVGEEGETALQGGNVERARTLLLACIELNPASALCHRSLGVLFARVDDTKMALHHYKSYVRLAPDAPDAARVRRMIADSERKH
jgi:regulator of sirC expression with transglutaminase-like and TPR domain